MPNDYIFIIFRAVHDGVSLDTRDEGPNNDVRCRRQDGAGCQGGKEWPTCHALDPSSLKTE